MQIRNKFPFLKRKYHGRPLAYLDNASTTQKPQVVLDELLDAYENHYANIHRGVYDLSVEATELYENTRFRVAKFINAKSEKEVVFTRNTTEGINLLAYGCQNELEDGDEILLTQMEHHSNIVPWQLLSKRVNGKSKVVNGLKIKYVPITKDGRLDLGSLDKLVTKKTKVFSLTLMSNVLGTINDVSRIIPIVRRLTPGAIVIVDAAQAVGHMDIDVQALGCDFLLFSAHKMYGPSGVGVLWGKYDLLLQMPPFMGGGDMILSVDWQDTVFNEVPYKFEAGTPSIVDVIAFGEAIKFIEQFGYEQINKHEMELTKYALNKLSNYPSIQLYGPSTLNDRGPVISFNVDGVHPHDVASILSSDAVAIRSGHHCAQPLMKLLGIDAACRASFGIYNTKEEVDRLVDGFKKVQKVFGKVGKRDGMEKKSKISLAANYPIVLRT